MDKPTVEVGKSIGYGWETVKKDFWYFVGIAIVAMVISGVGSSREIGRTSWNIIGLLLSAYMMCGYMKIVLSYQAGKKLPFGDLFMQWKYYLRILGAQILLGIIIGIGFILLIVPGIYLALRYQFTFLLIIDRDLGIGAAMNESSRLTQGIKMSLLGFDLACLGVVILGAIVFGVGVFVATPVVWLATVALYRKLSSAQPSQNQPAA